ncbi:hypothetical protein ZWY2020_001450 [Hordeum vulgare]|nr:hypothetical protein ZWY2020_001450 [Hordeum vulgare]
MDQRPPPAPALGSAPPHVYPPSSPFRSGSRRRRRARLSSPARLPPRRERQRPPCERNRQRQIPRGVSSSCCRHPPPSPSPSVRPSAAASSGNCKMDSLELEDSGEHQPSLEVSLASDVIYDDAPVCPCIGSEHQAEIPNLCTEDERQQLMTSSLGSVLPGFDYPVTVGLAIPVTWKPSKVRKEEEFERHHSSEIEARSISQDEDSPVTSVCPTSNDTSDRGSTYQDPHPMVPVDHLESGSERAHDGNLNPCSTQEGLNFTSNPMMQQGEIDQFTPLPCASTSLWSGIEAECFLLGLYVFGKNLSLLSRFVGNKTIGDVLSYYYGKFYKRDAYRRWSDCRKARTRRCILGERIFTSWRQQEIISRLKSVILNEAHDSLVEIFKSFNDGHTSLEDFVFALKSTVGTEALVEAVGIGKKKRDLTGFILDPSKPNQVLSIHPDMPTGKDCSLLASEDIIKFLTGDFRRSKTRSNDLFWEAVWPRLLARGWHSEQPKDVSTTKNSLVFLVPGIKKFSRSKLTKGTHYFDSVSDVLKRVAADPILLDLEVGGLDNNVTAEQNGYDTDMQLNQDDPLDGNQELPRFTIIDTTLVQGQEPFRVRELRRLPADAKVRPVPSRQSRKVVTVSSSEESDADGQFSDDQEYRGQDTADVNDTEIFSVRNVNKETQVDSLQNMVTASCSDFPVNGHSSNGSEKPREQIRGASNTLANYRLSEKMKVKKLYEDKSFERKVDALTEVHSKITMGETKFAKGARASSSVGQVKQETPLDSMTGAIVCVTLSDDDDCMMAEEAPSISSSDQADSRRHGTRNRPPTAKALEALALGLLGGKRKGEPKSPGTSRPPRRARKSSKKSVHTPTGSDTDKSSMDADAQG